MVLSSSSVTMHLAPGNGIKVYPRRRRARINCRRFHSVLLYKRRINSSDLFQLKCDLSLNEIVPLILAVVPKDGFCLSGALMVWLVKKFWMSVAIIF